MRWQFAIIASLALAACETNEAADPVDVTAAELAGVYDLSLVGGAPAGSLDPDYCLVSRLTMEAGGGFVVAHSFDERVATGTTQACRTDADRTQVDVEWRGTFENTGTLVVLTIDEVATTITAGDSTVSAIAAENTELIGEFNPETDRLAVTFPEIWGFNPHGGSGGRISIDGGDRGLGAGTLVFQRLP